MSSFIDSPQAGMTPIPSAKSSPRLSEAEFITRYLDEPFELITGRLKESPVPTFFHSFLCGMMVQWIGEFLTSHPLGRVVCNDIKVRFGAETILGPDVAYFSFDRLPKGVRPSYPTPIIPELVVEVRSPSNTWDELFSKVQIYLQAGVLIALIVDEETSSVSIYRSGASQQTLQANEELTLPDLFPGFTKPISQLFD